MLRKIAIVGGNGFVGRHVIEMATQRGIQTLGIVRSDTGAAVVKSLGGEPLELASLDQSNAPALSAALVGYDGVVYTASVSTGIKGADRTEPGGLLTALAACREAGVGRLVLFSGLGIAHYGMNEHCTNPYFLAKMAGEVAAFRSGVPTTVLRPSYIFGAGDEFLSPLIKRIAADRHVEIPGDGAYRLQPVSVEDAARATLGAFEESHGRTSVVDLVGPEIISYRGLIGRIAAAMNVNVTFAERPIEEAISQSRASGYFGLRPHDLACLLCDEVSVPAPAERLVGNSLEPLDTTIARAVARLRGEGETV